MTQDYYRQIINSFGDGICIIDVFFDELGLPEDGIYLETNPKYEEYIGKTNVLGQKISDLFLGTKQECPDFLARIVSGKAERIKIEYKPTGKWLELSAFKICGQDENRLGIQLRDITERKKVDESLLESETQYRDIVESANCILIKMDKEGTITHFNKFAQSFFGYSNEEIIGKNVRILLPSSEEENGYDFLEMADKIQENPNNFVENTNQNVLKNGELAWVSWGNKAIINQSGEIIGCLAVGQDVNYKKKTVEQLRVNEELFRTTLRNSPVNVSCQDLNLYYTWQYNAQLGYADETVVGKTDYKLLPSDTADQVVALKRQAIASGVRQREVVSVAIGDEHLYYDFTAVPLQNSSGHIIGVTNVVVDITERKRIEEALRESLIREKVFSELTSSVLKCEDPQTSIKEVCKNAMEYVNCDVFINFIADEERLYLNSYSGISIEAAESINYLDFGVAVCGCVYAEGSRIVVPDIQNSPDPRVELVKSFGIQCYASFPLKSHDRVIGTLSFGSKKRKEFTEDELQFMNSVSEYISIAMSRLLMLKSLKKSEERFRIAQEMSPDGFTILHPVKDETGCVVDFIFVYQNESIAQIGGTDSKAVVRKRLLDIFPSHKGTSIFEAYCQVAVTGESQILEEASYIGEGMPHTWFRLVIVSMGEDIAIHAQEISERKRSEQALRESEQKALALVKELEESDKNKNLFISVLSHELRNPLAVIVASLSLLEISDKKEQVLKTKEIVNREVDQLCKLVDDLLDITRINQKKIKLKKDSINLNKILKNAAADMEPQYEAKGLSLRLMLQQTPIFINADPVRITQIIGNLLINAHKYTPAGGNVKLSLETEKNEAIIRVRDNGMGISPELLECLFDPFIQDDTSIDRHNCDGLGLGLSIVKGIVQLHNGSVSAYSDGIGKGSIFTVRLPLSEQEIVPLKQVTAEELKKSYKILLIDDNERLTDMLKAMLEIEGHAVFAAHNGAQGISEAKRLKPDIIFCDIGLPGLNGYEVAKTLKSDPELISTYLVAMTGYAGELEIEQSKAAGFDLHLAKPVNLAILKKVLSENASILNKP